MTTPIPYYENIETGAKYRYLSEAFADIVKRWPDAFIGTPRVLRQWTVFADLTCVTEVATIRRVEG